MGFETAGPAARRRAREADRAFPADVGAASGVMSASAPSDGVTILIAASVATFNCSAS